MSEYDEEPLLDAYGGERMQTLDLEQEVGRSQGQRRYLYAPISYEQAIAPRRAWYSPMRWYAVLNEYSHVLDSIQLSDKVWTIFDRARIAFYVLWPKNRMHQTILIVFVLWIMVSYVSFSVDELLPDGPVDDRVYTGYSQLLYGELEDVKLRPEPGEGAVTQNATWEHEYCFSRGKPLRLFDAVGCKAFASFSLDAMPFDNSMISTDSSFITIDKGRPVPKEDSAPLVSRQTEATQAAWPVPATIYLRTMEPTSQLAGKHKIEVNVTATFFRPARILFQRSLVAKVQRGHGTQGVQIITPQVSRHAHLESHPLQYEVTVSVPPELVAGFEIDAPNADVQLFTELAQSFTTQEVDVSDQLPEILAQLLGDKKHSDAKKLAPNPKHRVVNHAFGHFRVVSDSGNIVTGGAIESNSRLSLSSRTGEIAVAGNLTSRELELQTTSGRIAVLDKSSCYSSKRSSIKTESGLILLDDNTRLSSVKNVVKTESGFIGGNGVWHTNLTLSLESNQGPINASVAVHRPYLANVEYDDFLHSQQGRLVSNTFESKNASVSVKYVEQEPGVPLRISASTTQDIKMFLAPTYEGALSVLGRQAELRQGVLSSGRHLDNLVKKKQGTKQSVNATTYWETQARPKLLPSVDSIPLIEPGKSVLSYSPGCFVESFSGLAQVYLAN
ncbi:hypothetical protein MYAM1_001316 [Malassezia yamatoensis]|uniref:Adhesin domain-containing protein n=1 Tax=Malassezia yamatoensis TaxID=253288 RepID=A0AAJ5YTQ8_9BASI|nr:hypothetical protein MYAM1_001316 [Malassezia yamatoensis]